MLRKGLALPAVLILSALLPPSVYTMISVHCVLCRLTLRRAVGPRQATMRKGETQHSMRRAPRAFPR